MGRSSGDTEAEIGGKLPQAKGHQALQTTVPAWVQEGPMRMEAESGVMGPQVKEHQG